MRPWYSIFVCIYASEAKRHEIGTHLVRPTPEADWMTKKTKNLNLDPQCSIPLSDVIRDLGVPLASILGVGGRDSQILSWRIVGFQGVVRRSWKGLENTIAYFAQNVR